MTENVNIDLQIKHVNTTNIWDFFSNNRDAQ